MVVQEVQRGRMVVQEDASQCIRNVSKSDFLEKCLNFMAFDEEMSHFMPF